MLDAIRHTATGFAIITEWLGAGGRPVPVIQAESRAATCAVCPKNITGKWLSRLKKEVADRIREHLAVKNGVGLIVSNEERLGFCEQCGCVNSLKVWTPIDHILHHTPQHTVLEYPDRCWIRKELTST